MTEDDLNRAVQEYQKNWSLYEDFTVKLRELIHQLLDANGLEVENIEFRTKRVEDFSEKIRREGKSYDDPFSQVTDLCGLRIVTYYIEDVERVGDILRKEFQIDDDNSLDKAELMDPDRFGYLSVHYVVSLTSGRARLTEWKPFSALKAEIQVRTVLQHAWAAIDHKLRYKTAREVPTNLKRQLFRLSALLELADEEFAQLSERSEATTEEYVSEVQRGQYEIEVNLDSLDSYLESSDLLTKWQKQARKAGFQPSSHKYDIDGLRHLLITAQTSGIKRIAELDDLFRGASKWGLRLLRKVRELSANAGFVPFADPYDVLTIFVMKARIEYLGQPGLQNVAFREELKQSVLEVAGYAGDSD